MRNENGVTLITVVIMIVIIAIIASVSIMNGVSTIKEAQNQVNESNMAAVRNVVAEESAKLNTAGVLTPANSQLYGVKNAVLQGIQISGDGTSVEVKKAIGNDWYYLDENSLKDMGIEYAGEEYVVNYKLNAVIPLSTTTNVHEQIERFEKEN